MQKNVIAVDGFSASGKGSLCTSLSKKLNIPYLNTEKMVKTLYNFLELL